MGLSLPRANLVISLVDDASQVFQNLWYLDWGYTRHRRLRC